MSWEVSQYSEEPLTGGYTLQNNDGTSPKASSQYSGIGTVRSAPMTEGYDEGGDCSYSLRMLMVLCGLAAVMFVVGFLMFASFSTTEGGAAEPDDGQNAANGGSRDGSSGRGPLPLLPSPITVPPPDNWEPRASSADASSATAFPPVILPDQLWPPLTGPLQPTSTTTTTTTTTTWPPVTGPLPSTSTTSTTTTPTTTTTTLTRTTTATTTTAITTKSTTTKTTTITASTHTSPTTKFTGHYQPLLCSVDGGARKKTSFPPDGICDILIYTYVHVKAAKKSGAPVLPVDDNGSFEAFLKACGNYTEGTCGASFDASKFHRTQPTEPDVSQWIKNLIKTAQVQHFGILNIYKKGDDFQRRYNEAYAGAKNFRSVLGQNREKNKLFYGVGSFSNKPEGFNLKKAMGSFGRGDTDIMVLLNVAYTDLDAPPCYAWPANDLPRLERALKYIPKEARNFNYSRTVAISLQMGVARYLMHAVYRNVERAVNKKCNDTTFLPYSEVCQPPTATVTIKDAVFDFSRGPPTILRTWNTFELLETKAKRIMSEKNIRSNFTWFLWNVHLTDPTSQCLRGGPFDRIKKFRNLYRTEYGKMSG